MDLRTVEIATYYERSAGFPYPANIEFGKTQLTNTGHPKFHNVVKAMFISVDKLAMAIDESSDSINILDFDTELQIPPGREIFRYFFEVERTDDDYYGCVDVIFFPVEDSKLGAPNCTNVFPLMYVDKTLTPQDYLMKVIDTININKPATPIEDTSTKYDNVISEVDIDRLPPLAFLLDIAKVCSDHSPIGYDKAVGDMINSISIYGTPLPDLLKKHMGGL